MAVAHSLGFPRIGRDRELKKAQEAFWKGELDEAGLRAVGRELRKAHWDLQKKAGIELTSSYAMNPPASVSGLYFSHEEAVYFAVGRIEKDQVEDYAARKGMDIAAVERWLTPVLNYDPVAFAKAAAE